MTIAQGPRTSERPPILARRYAVASGHYLATEAAMRIFRQGGNAIDAGVAAGICIDVLLPDLCSFGGVAPIMIHHARTGETLTISGLGKWGKSASLQHFIDHEDGKLPTGAKRSIVPGAPDAWLTALARYGKLTFAEVVQPAIELCEGGFVVYPSLHRNLAKAEARIAGWPSSASIFLHDGKAPESGRVLFQHDLAHTFRRMIAAESAVDSRSRVAGADAARNEFYRGDIAKEIATFIQEEGGSVGEEDLATFNSEIEEPPGTTFNGIDVRVCGPWSQGPVIPQTLNIIAGEDLAGMGHNSANYIHVVSEAMNLAFSDREHYYGDPNYVYVPMDLLMSPEYGNEQRARIDMARAFGEMPAAGGSGSLADAARSKSPAQADTSYVCAIDDEGNAFSATPSDGIGSTPIIPGLGLICSGRGSQSWIDADHPSSLHPGKRPRLTPNPAMAFKDGRLFMPFGTPGGDMQPQSMLQTFLNVVVFGMDVQQAIEAPRFGTFSYPESFYPHTYRPGRLNLEGRISASIGDELATRGHDIEWWPDWTRIAGNVCAIKVNRDNGSLEAGADARAEAYANGW